MTWTSEKPKAPGWYWWRPVPHGGQIVFVFACNAGLCVDFGNGDAIPITSITYQWAGPITKPEEP